MLGWVGCWVTVDLDFIVRLWFELGYDQFRFGGGAGLQLGLRLNVEVGWVLG